MKTIMTSLGRVATVATLAISAAAASAAVTWNFNIDTTSDQGNEAAVTFNGGGEPFFQTPNDTTKITGTAGASGGGGDFALQWEDDLPKGANYTFAGLQLWIKNGRAAYNAQNATQVTFKARLVNGADVANWGIALEDTTGACVDPGNTFTLTTSWQTFSAPVSGDTILRSGNCSPTGNMDIQQIDSVVFRPVNPTGFVGATVPIGIQIDDVQIDGAEGAPVTPQPLTNMDIDFSSGIVNSAGGTSMVSTGDQNDGDHNDDGITSAIVSGEFQIGGQYTSTSGAGWWWVVWFTNLDPNNFARDITGATHVRITARKFDASDTMNWYARIEDGITPSHLLKFIPLNLTTTEQVINIPLGDFAASGGTGYGSGTGTNLANAKTITVFTEAAANPSMQTANQVVAPRLSLNRVQLLNTASVPDWSIY